MDPVTHVALGTSITLLALQGRSPVRRAALFGALAGCAPDLDVLWSHGDPIADMLWHRGATHALPLQALFAVLVGVPLARWFGPLVSPRRAALACFLVLATHSLCDAMNTYGTRLWLPFVDTPVALGSLFVIDPLVTLPLLVGAGLALRRGTRAALRGTAIGLLLAVGYTVWSLVAQALVTAHAGASLAAQGQTPSAILATPAPLQTLLWRVVALDGERCLEGSYSWFDDGATMRFSNLDRGGATLAAIADWPGVAELTAFSGGFVKAWRDERGVHVADLRMGQEPHYAFVFTVAPATAPLLVPRRIEIGKGFAWLLQRVAGLDVPAPR